MEGLYINTQFALLTDQCELISLEGFKEWVKHKIKTDTSNCYLDEGILEFDERIIMYAMSKIEDRRCADKYYANVATLLMEIYFMYKKNKKD